MSDHNVRNERRRDLRVSPKGTVIMHAEGCTTRGRIVNLSRGGVAAITTSAVPVRLLGGAASLDLRLDGRDSSWLDVRGRIVRIEDTAIALALEAAPPEFVRVLDELVTAAHCNRRVLSIVLVDATSARRSDMAEAFRAAGCAVIEVSTPLEAIVRLGESEFEPDLIAIADSLPATISEELRRFVDGEHPRVKLVTIGDGASAPLGLAHWLSAANPAGDLASRIRTVLTTFARN